MTSGRPLSPPPLGRRVRLAILAAWLGLGLTEALKAVIAERLRGETMGLDVALIANLPWWLGWAGLTPPAIWVASRVRFDRGRWLGPLAVHLGVAAALAAIHLIGVGVLFYLTVARGGFFPTLEDLLQNWADTFVIVEILTYGAVVCGYYAIDYRRRFRERELEAARLAVRAAQAEARMHEAQLTALRAELNPHFLFNALNAVGALIRRREPGSALDVLARLGDLLRATLGRSERHEIPLAQELDYVRRYLEIEQTRYSDRLTVRHDIAADAADALVPTLLLQPLVENAVRHGVAGRPGPGEVLVHARRQNGDLGITIEDTGPGFPAGGTAVAEGVGLRNTRERLAQLYGAAGRLEIANRPGGGARVRVVLPYHAGGTDARGD
jgi:sensor histidine kinase YesM